MARAGRCTLDGVEIRIKLHLDPTGPGTSRWALVPPKTDKLPEGGYLEFGSEAEKKDFL